MTSYKLNVINKSELDRPIFALFAKLPQTSDYDSLHTAWLTQQVDTGNRYSFTWDVAWGLAWSAQGIGKGVRWTAGNELTADPNSTAKSAARLDYDGDFTLDFVPGTPTGDTLTVTDTGKVPLRSVKPSSIGVTLDGNVACVTNAGPNLTQTFTLHPTYFIDAGNYVQGQMVDGSSATTYQELEFAGGVTELTVTLNPDNTWTFGSVDAPKAA
ncbi:hypothetical protein [Actinosynnema sp. NPDC020468]|uniref:hypothetical protein n=1 Tax=Actinosynnema sp. NPDC020468 TaxID=3154488 RepID=UPI0033F2E3EA